MSWTLCDHGHAHWGASGAAGVLIVDGGRVLLQRRSTAVHQGETWSIPCGAIEPGETPEQTARREAREEIGATKLRPYGSHVAECGGWRFTTVLATTTQTTFTRGWETQRLAWVETARVAGLERLHPAFEASWPALKEILCSVST